jgi:hypothetical protein
MPGTICLTPMCMRVSAPGIDYCCVPCAQAGWVTKGPGVAVTEHGAACVLRCQEQPETRSEP